MQALCIHCNIQVFNRLQSKHEHEPMNIKAGVGRFLASFDRDFLITFQHVVIGEKNRFLHFLLALFSGFRKSWDGRLCQSQIISERGRS